MRQLFILATALCPALFAAAATPTLDDILHKWTAADSYATHATFSVSMPQMPDDVIYQLDMVAQRAADTDTLSPISYLIEWTLPAQTRSSEGFSAYYDGNHYRYSGGERLQEYHIEADPTPFQTRGKGHRRTPGVHRSAQFVALFPAMMAEELSSHLTDSAYTVTLHPDTLASGCRRPVIDITYTVDGTICQEGEYLLDPSTLLPVRVTLENNPGSISEQTVATLYTEPTQPAVTEPISEELLIARHPQVFGQFRQSTFRTEALAGHPLPGFALPTVTGERYSRNSGDRFRAPAIIAILDPATGFSSETVASLRRAADRLPYSPDLIFAALSSNPDQVEELLGRPNIGEHHLMSAQPLARDCGVSDTPVIIMVTGDGIVRHVVTGYSPDLENTVVNNMSGYGV